MTDVSQAPSGLPPVAVVDESGGSTPGGGNTAWMKGAPGPAATQGLPHPEPRPIVEGEVPFDEAVGPIVDLAGLAEQIRQLAAPEAMPWVFRGPLVGASPDGGDLQLPQIPSGEVWEIERLTIMGDAADTWSLWENGVTGNGGNLLDVSGNVATYVTGYSPAHRIGAGSRLLVHGAAGTHPFSVRVQYRMFRLPRPGHDRVGPVVRLP